MTFKVAARTLLHLGAELISSDGVAFYELIKNGLDAGSRVVRLDVLIALPQPGTAAFAGGCIPGATGNSPNGVCTLPLIVYRHGLNSSRAAMLGVADRFTSAGYAVVAIDANKHGDRAFCDPTSTTTVQCVGDTAGSPSTRNSHCHPASRATPSNESSAPEIGPPTMPATKLAVMNAAIARARSRSGNHRVK